MQTDKILSKPINVGFFHIMRENFSGAQKNIFRLLINLDIKEINPILLGQSESPLTKKVKKKEIKTLIVPFPPGLSVFDQKILKFNPSRLFNFIKGIISYNKKLIDEYRDLKLDVIWCDNIRTFVTIYFACKSLKVKIIWNVWSEPKGKVAWVLHRIGLFMTDSVNVEYNGQQKKIFGSLAKFPSLDKKIFPLYTGVSDFDDFKDSNIRSELSLKKESILVVMASNIVPGKGQIDLIKCIKDLRNQFPNLNLLLAGAAVTSSQESLSYLEELKDYVKKHDLYNFIHFIGWRNDIRDIYKMSDIYVSTSYSESFPDAVREAMLESLPVIVTNVGGTRELVDEEENGYLFQPGDIINLTKSLKKLIFDPELRKKMGLKSRKIIDDRFSTKAYARNFEDMLKKTINS